MFIGKCMSTYWPIEISVFSERAGRSSIISNHGKLDRLSWVLAVLAWLLVKWLWSEVPGLFLLLFTGLLLFFLLLAHH
jgi:hypothetical protein